MQIHIFITKTYFIEPCYITELWINFYNICKMFNSFHFVQFSAISTVIFYVQITVTNSIKLTALREAPCIHIFSRFAIIIHVSLNKDYCGVKIIELRHDNARKSGRSATVRQKLICRARERRDTARRVASRRFLISSFASAKSHGQK